MPSHAGTGSPAADGAAAPAPSWQHEPAVRAALREHWDLPGQLRRLRAGDSRTWRAGGHVVKLARDEPVHFNAGLRASEAVERTWRPVMDAARLRPVGAARAAYRR